MIQYNTVEKLRMKRLASSNYNTQSYRITRAYCIQNSTAMMKYIILARLVARGAGDQRLQE